MLSKLLYRPQSPRARLAQMAAHITNGSSTNGTSSYGGVSLADLPKSWNFTSKLPADPKFPTPAASHKTPRDKIVPATVKGSLFSWVRPEEQIEPELLAISSTAMRDIGIREGEEKTDEFRETVVGNRIQGWDAEKEEGGYPWAQCYGGWQFGSWAGQLGDGRAISLFEATNPETKKRYELQLKGAGMTPYSRFADGKAVFRSSMREFIVSEYLNALGIPTTRALSLSFLPKSRVRREMTEPGAIVLRFAESWLRIGTFDLLRARGDRILVRRLCDYIAEDVFPGWQSLPARNPADDGKSEGEIGRDVAKDAIEGPEGLEENRYTRLYREIVRRNAKTVAAWQAYAFTNGVLNTDNTSIFGLSLDFGPFAFLDNFDPSYTPNHDDHMLRYSYRNQPTIIWWNLVRLGETLGELMGIGSKVDEEEFVAQGIRQEAADDLIARAEGLISRVGEEYKAVFLTEYKRLMTARLGLKTFKEGDFDNLFSELLDTMEALELDFNHFFRRLSSIKLEDLTTEAARRDRASVFFHREGVTGIGNTEAEARTRIAKWLEQWKIRITEDWGESSDAEREAAMKQVNPKFVPRGWILDEVIQKVEKEGEREVLQGLTKLALSPFEETWGWDKEQENKWCGDVPRAGRAMQCSCSS